MNEMIERGAKALWAVSSEPEHGDSWSSLSPEWKDNFRAHARAVIEAIRDPTKKMTRAAAKALCPDYRPTPDYIPVRDKHRLRYQAMIDEALK